MKNMGAMNSVFLLLLFTSTAAPSGNVPSGFLELRSDASMFYWLMRAGNETHDYKSFPFVIFLAGGPGDSSTGYTNFFEIGPIDMDGNERNKTWLNHANLLFFDNPVGCGYSYVREGGQFVRNTSMITTDFVEALKMLLNLHPEFKTLPSYMFGESYGGKMAIAAAREIHQQKIAGTMDFNLLAVGLGDAWISPFETTKTWPDYLHTFSFIDLNERDILDHKIEEIEQLWLTGQKDNATFMWQDLFAIVNKMGYGLDLHNVFGKLYDWKKLEEMMNSAEMRKKLNIPANVTWNSQGKTVFNQLANDFLCPVTQDVEFILNKTNINVIVYSGQFDVIVTMKGTEQWIGRLNWKGREGFRRVRKQLIARTKDDQPLLYMKEHENLKLFYFLEAGHSVPANQLDASVKMLQRVTG